MIQYCNFTYEFRLLFLGFIVTLALTSSVPDQFINAGSLFAMMTLGMYHGSYDVVELNKLFPRLVRRFFAYLSYLVIALVLLFLSWISPIIFFTLFFFESVFHFGYGDSLIQTKWRHLESIARGLLPFTVSGTFHPEEVKPFFSLLLKSNLDVEIFTAILPYLLIVNIIAFALLVFYQKQTKVIAEIVLIAFCFYFLKPYPAFTLYFVLFHTFRHLREKNEDSSILIHKTLFNPLAWFATLLVALPLIIFGLTDEKLSLEIKSYPFFAFAALTFPHGLLNYFKKNI